MVIILPCQGRDTGSIPVTRSEFEHQHYGFAMHHEGAWRPTPHVVWGDSRYPLIFSKQKTESKKLILHFASIPVVCLLFSKFMRRKWRKAKPKPKKFFRANEFIRIPEVFLIDENDQNIGVLPTAEALKRAREAGLDLVEVNPKVRPSVAKIMDYDHFKYENEKKAKKQKLQQKKMDIKGIRLSVRISRHDFDFRLKQAEKFLEKGNKLKIELILKGRERQHPAKAVETINEFVGKLEGDENLNIVREQDLTKQGGRFTIVLVNKSN